MPEWSTRQQQLRELAKRMIAEDLQKSNAFDQLWGDAPVEDIASMIREIETVGPDDLSGDGLARGEAEYVDEMAREIIDRSLLLQDALEHNYLRTPVETWRQEQQETLAKSVILADLRQTSAFGAMRRSGEFPEHEITSLEGKFERVSTQAPDLLGPDFSDQEREEIYGRAKGIIDENRLLTRALEEGYLRDPEKTHQDFREHQLEQLGKSLVLGEMRQRGAFDLRGRSELDQAMAASLETWLEEQVSDVPDVSFDKLSDADKKIVQRAAQEVVDSNELLQQYSRSGYVNPQAWSGVRTEERMSARSSSDDRSRSLGNSGAISRFDDLWYHPGKAFSAAPVQDPRQVDRNARPFFPGPPPPPKPQALLVSTYNPASVAHAATMPVVGRQYGVRNPTSHQGSFDTYGHHNNHARAAAVISPGRPDKWTPQHISAMSPVASNHQAQVRGHAVAAH